MKCGKHNTAIIPFRDGGRVNAGKFSEVQNFWTITWFLEAQGVTGLLIWKVQFPSEIAQNLLPPLKHSNWKQKSTSYYIMC